MWHSEWAEYAFLKIFSLHSYFCKYVYICLKSCFASLVTKGKSISSISLVYQNLHTFFYKNTTNGVEPQFLFFFEPKNLRMLFFFSIFTFNMKMSHHSQPIYSDTSAKKSMCFSDKGVLKTKFYQILFKKLWGACWYTLYNISLIINNTFFAVAPIHWWVNTIFVS